MNADTVEDSCDWRDSGQADTPWLVEIQPGGAKPPLFILRPGLQFRPTVAELGPDQPVYGLHDQPLLEKRDLTLQGVAAAYARGIRTVQPEGPYFLGGYCLGGKLAFAVAQELDRQGQRVAFLAILESDSPGHRPRLSSGRAFLSYNLPKIPFHLRRLAGLGTKQRLLYVRKRIRNFRIIGIRKMMGFVAKVWHRTGRPLPRSMRTDFLLDLATNYTPQPYPGRITLFRVQWPRRENDPTLGWARFAAGVEVHEFPGDHQTVFREPHVRLLARELKTCLEAAQAAATVLPGR